MEEINLNFDEPEELQQISLDLDSNKTEDSTLPSQPSVNSGGGLELLMNEKRKDSMSNKSSSSSKLNIADDLENELNALDNEPLTNGIFCLLYTSDAADEP